ncbi:hypothetical protein [Sulfurimonas sp.]|uniref:hypothetical protein n=1 Tax=Sulfurimonas sp. TaxID=2022749 RepID=UPI0025FE667F|nr:hypothetical protein [Sulfurimonas sp.]MCK9454852.1 hypothetical protein [Sulfurimonas sp.]
MIQPSEAVVHLSIYRDDIKLAVGTGVFYKKNNKSYIITAWHNVSGRHSETLESLSTNLSVPNKIIATFSQQVSQGEFNGSVKMSISLPLEKDGKPTYLIHPQGWPKVDVVAIPIDLTQEYLSEGSLIDGKKINLATILKHQNSVGLSTNIVHVQDLELRYKDIEDYSDYLYASEDIFIIGYPKGITDYTGQPIWKRATVASNPHLGWDGQEQFLVDCASKEGMSGAPTFFYNRKGAIMLGNTQLRTSSPITIFHGIYVGRIGATSEFEAQIGRVWKKKVIEEIIDNDQFDYSPDELILFKKDIIKAIEENWPKDRKKYAQDMLKENSMLSKIFLNTTMQKLNGRANYQEVEKYILEFANSLVNE